MLKCLRMDNLMKSPRPMRLTDRDLLIFEAIHACEGMLGAQQIRCFPDKNGNPFFDSWRTTRERLSKLYQNGYLARPDRQQRAAITDMVYWLTERSAELVAGLHGQELNAFHWRKQPRWSLVTHDLALNDFRIAMLKACQDLPGVELECWIPSIEFWADSDAVHYQDEHYKQAKRRVRPDGYFVIRCWNAANDKWDHFRFLLEIDMASEHLPRYAREKVRPGVAYLKSAAYAQRFGANAGRWLVVTTSPRRMRNMKRQTETVAGRDAGLFYFTTFDQVRPQTVLEAIWYRGGEEQPIPLFS